MLRRFRKVIALIVCMLLVVPLSACSVRKATDEEIQAKFDKFCDGLFKDILEEDSFNAHFLVSDAEVYGVTYDEEDYNLGQIEIDDSAFDYINDALKDLRTYNRDSLTDEQKLTYDSLEAYLEMQLSFEGTELVQNYFGLSSGLVANLSTNFIEFMFYEKDDIDHYLMYLKDVDRYVDDMLDILVQQSEAGYFMSDYLADQVIEQCDKLLNAENEALIITFEDKLDGMDLTDEEKEAYIAVNNEYVSEHYLPAYRNIKDTIESLKGTGTNEGGLCNYGDMGIDYYKAVVKNKTSSDMTPEEVIELLDDEVSDLLKELTAIVIADYEAYETFLYLDAGFDTPEAVLEYILDNMESDFPAPATDNYSIEYQNKACEIEGTLAYYVTSRLDDISGNNIKVNGSAVESGSMTMYTTLAHEGYPGHLYQFTGFYNNDDVHNIRKVLDFIGATEGWAQYASNCTLDYLDVSDNEKRIIIINDLISYIVVSRTDLGVNYEGWDIDDTYEYLSMFFDVDDDYDSEDNAVVSIYESVVGDPGLYLPYTVGHILMNDMREKAEEELGSDFDAKEYHQWINDVGITSFEVYENQLEQWLAQKQ